MPVSGVSNCALCPDTAAGPGPASHFDHGVGEPRRMVSERSLILVFIGLRSTIGISPSSRIRVQRLLQHGASHFSGLPGPTHGNGILFVHVLDGVEQVSIVVKLITFVPCEPDLIVTVFIVVLFG